MAIGASPTKKLKLCQIYDYIKERFPFYRVSKKTRLNLISFYTYSFYLDRVKTARAGKTP